MDLSKLTIASARKALDAKEFTARELTEAYLDEINKKNGELQAYLEVWSESAREEAKKADERIARGESAPLTGIPLAIKDNMLVVDRRITAASKILENYIASYDASVIKKLKEQNAVLLGRTNMDEFALGSSTENSAFGPTKNPHDISRVPGGTSGGSTAAVAANLALGALGSDTGGSLRQPAAFCGTVGFKPTYGAVSRYGLIAAASSLDQIGTVGKTVEDAQIIFDAIRGHDENDSTSLPDSAFTKTASVKKVVGVPRAFLKEGVEADMLENFEQTLKSLKAAGYSIVDVDLPALEYSLAVYYIINPAEVSTNLARFDGIRYGLSVPADTIGETYERSRGIGFGPETRRRMLVGTFVLSSGYADAYYRKARDVRELIRADFAKAFESVDAIAMPTSPTAPWKIGGKADPLSVYAADIFTVPINLAGVPAISIPSGSVERDGKKLPVGFQIIAPHRGEAGLFAIAKDVEKSAV
ncbi:MAG: Asp-tRNA(Asn)/Glu-tRNA(Gln) amidotransferase subunit GatA [Candidatus Kaiserbacteria bacterium]|nr:Asp-tRNA(Asn)/Glu-tRNA(Gln) amidotransferase subunit GatA [Candidatus Kaiserbacteria bacterium]